MAAKTQSVSHRLSEMWGIRYSEKKRQAMSVNTHFLGNAYDWSEWIARLAATFGVKPNTKVKYRGMLRDHIQRFVMTQAQASKVRGLLQWVDRGLTGRPCRGALTALTERPYFEDKPTSLALSSAAPGMLVSARGNRYNARQEDMHGSR